MSTSPSLSHLAWSRYKKNLPSYLALSLAFLLVGAALLALEISLCYVGFSGTLFATIPFVLIPFAFSIQFAMTHIRTGEALSSGLIRGGWARYMSLRSPYFGAYRVVVSFLKSFLAYIVPYLATALIYASIASKADPTFNEAINTIYDMFRDETVTMQSIYEYINSTPCIINLYVCSLGAGTSVGSYIFVRCLFINSASTYIRGMMLGGKAAPRVGNAIFQYGFRKIRGDYFKQYYKAMWPFIPLLIVGFAGGYLLACFLPVSLPLNAAPCFGFAGELLLVSFFLPYAFEVQQELTFRYAKEYSSASVELAKMNLETLKQQQALDEEQSKIIDEQIKEAEKKMKEAEEKDKENSDSDHR